MSFNASDVRQFCHEFALATIDAVSSYLDVLEEVTELLDAPESAEWQERISGVRKLSLRMIISLAPLSVSLTELDLDASAAELDPDDDVRSVQTLMQAVIDAVGVFAPLETRGELEDIVVLTPATIGRLLDRDRTEAKLAAHLLRENGRELGSWPDWRRYENAGAQ